MLPFIALSGIAKRFGGVHAIEGIDFDVHAGEVHALVGENGAGKSTLMRVIGGGHQADAGTIRVEGREITFRNPHASLAEGIAVIHQETALAPDLSVAENVFLGAMPAVLDWRALRMKARALIESLGFEIDPAALVETMSAAQCQVIEIAKALSGTLKLLVLDEPTAALAPSDANRLLDIVRDLKARGVGIVYISHRLEEVFAIADRITVLKDGKRVDTVTPGDITRDELIRKMVGRPLSVLFPERHATPGAEVLKVEGLTRGRAVQDVSFSLRAGEVVGLGGLIGSGRTEVARLIFGADTRDAGHIELKNKPLHARSPMAAVRAGIGFVPEDRKGQGAVLGMPIRINATLAALDSVSGPFGWLAFRRERAAVAKLMDALRIKARSMDADVSTLSGGNQQKVVLAKWFHADGDLIILDEPTRGVDVGAKVEIYTLVNQLAERGKAVLVISSDHQELMGLCDRILVMGEGRIRGQLNPDDYSEERILALSLQREAGEAPSLTHTHAEMTS
ncbi:MULTISPECIES: sugar ABC transporter ATP-binding protein [unclassified Caballeronia]|uniref:sugar ABC transporter ATP-binding protein n=1 Tax=unclassified Caballeronia TaxID=2646786 RepID=UPI00285B1815|nr:MULTISPECIES: sugar ABC transporter ATP-binding protein [unclassified Caballeronia]MDR5818325.1 sugar ABC transporter ATP-binding protein [Caballeronia sp. LZ033]MDR5825292.1 sugar ABC transporter ATP-binding protein [Caballeronia sp. LZ043]MDR5883168.1 sugar ABC transporter ATP-binding protein [Caballeronia sp. LZ032]